MLWDMTLGVLKGIMCLLDPFRLINKVFMWDHDSCDDEPGHSSIDIMTLSLSDLGFVIKHKL